MIGTIIAALVAGLIVGPLARLILPGRQNLSVGMTVLLGAVGSLLGVFLGSLFFDYEGGPLNFWGLLFGIGGALIVVLAYGAITGNKGSQGRVSR
ncbi:GlsB/YeaQ/YmgE family stress response membrane protein [Ornithinimicrobium sufpigmenti]|uniref:GlsB/YeaQ/YmgE family stress response membrane protein n=1 Tax=Ornithinimicrobium sufpigmenti TaxID=2508882 RepID=UPI001035C209|nr:MULTISPECIES: GlsB/YeaQ/YmgE family stress response membrane protein [unclassified Ornithinimicrobium]